MRFGIGKICCTFASEITFNLNGKLLNSGGIISRRFIKISASEALFSRRLRRFIGQWCTLMIPLQGGPCVCPVGRKTEYLYLPFGNGMATLLYNSGVRIAGDDHRFMPVDESAQSARGRKTLICRYRRHRVSAGCIRNLLHVTGQGKDKRKKACPGYWNMPFWLEFIFDCTGAS